MTLMVEELSDGDEVVFNGEDGCLRHGNVYKVREVADGSRYVICENGCHVLTERTLAEFSRFIQQRGGWVGVDLDGTLAVYDGWRGPYHIGAPIPKMVERVKAWLAQGRDVRVFTARVTGRATNADGTEHDLAKVRRSIEAYCFEHLGKVLPVTNVKDWDMMELWDDRAVQVRFNTGVTLGEELDAVRSAEAEPKYDGGKR